MARKTRQLIPRGPRPWLDRVRLGRDPETGTREYHMVTTDGVVRVGPAQEYPALLIT